MTRREFIDRKFGYRITSPPGWAISSGVLNSLANRIARRRVTLVCSSSLSTQSWVTVKKRRQPGESAEMNSAAHEAANGATVFHEGFVQCGRTTGYQTSFRTSTSENCCVVFGDDRWLYFIHFRSADFNLMTPTGTVFADFLRIIGTLRFDD